MKKYKWLIVLGIIVVVLSFIAVFFSEDESKYLQEVSINKIIKMKENNKSFILYIKQTNCEHCKVFTPRFINVLKKNNLKAYTLNIANLSEEDNKIYTDNFEVEGTPTVLFFENGSESLIRIEGEQTKEKIISKLEATGFIKEK